MTRIDRGGLTIAALVHDAALSERPDLLASVAAAAGLALENERLQGELRIQSQRSKRRGPGSWLPAMRSDDASNATCMMERSNGS